MVSLLPLSVCRERRSMRLPAVALVVLSVAQFQATAAAAPAGRLNFDSANLPEATVEVDLSQEMFKDLFGIGDAAIAGIAETVLNSVEGGTDKNKQTKLAAEQLEAAREIAQLVGNVVREVRVRAYESLPEGTNDPQKLFGPFEEQLRTAKWETIVKVREDDQIARVSVMRSDGAIQGVFVVATDGDGAVIANIVCDISPENVKKLTAAATKIGLKSNFQPKFKFNVSHLPGETEEHATIVIQNKTSATPPAPPTPPTPPTPSASIVK